MLLIKDILLQLLIITCPVLLYKSVWLDRAKSKAKPLKSALFVMVSCFSVVFCMSFPIHTESGMQFDLRSIPLIVTVLYGGYIPGIITSVVMLGYRLYLGGDGIPAAFVSFAVYGVFTFLLVNRWNAYSLRKKGGIIVLIGCLKECTAIVAAIILFTSQGLTPEMIVPRLVPIVKVGLLYVLAMVGIVHLVEFIRESAIIRNQIERSEKLNMISELAASVAHEVRNPLTVVRGFVQLLREDTNPKNNEYIKLVLNELDRAESIISDYLNLAKPQEEVSVRLDMTQTVREVAALMSSFAVMNGVEIDTRGQGELFVNGNAVKMKQALMNLMKNGIEAMHQGGVLRVRVEQTEAEVVVTICDQGEGMSAKQIERIGLPFASTKDKGTGLGLMVTCRIIEAMNGRILFESEPGIGTKVTIRMPAV